MNTIFLPENPKSSGEGCNFEVMLENVVWSNITSAAKRCFFLLLFDEFIINVHLENNYFIGKKNQFSSLVM